MSWPAAWASGPSWPQPVIRPKTRRGLRPRQTSGPRPSRSTTPGRKPSISTSADSMSLRTSSTPSAVFRSTAIERRPRETTSARPADSRPGKPPPPESRSTRMTVAPRSASIIPAKGPGPMPAISTTVIPDRGPISNAGALVEAFAHERTQAGHHIFGKGGEEPGLVVTRPVEDEVVEAKVDVRLDLGERGLGIGCHDPAAGHLLDREGIAGSLHLRRVAQAVLLLGRERQGGPEAGALQCQPGVRVVGELDLDHPVDRPVGSSCRGQSLVDGGDEFVPVQLRPLA